MNLHTNATRARFYDKIRDEGSWTQYPYWALWQPVRPVIFFGVVLFYKKHGPKFWLDTDGFYPINKNQ